MPERDFVEKPDCEAPTINYKMATLADVWLKLKSIAKSGGRISRCETGIFRKRFRTQELISKPFFGSSLAQIGGDV